MVNALVIEARNVLYQHQDDNQRLNAFLHSLGLSPRHPKVVAKGLKAARFDALHGRISRETYYDAILRFHGLNDENEFATGRAAIMGDTQNIRATERFPEVLQQLYTEGLQLSFVENTELTTNETVNMLAMVGYLPALWTFAVASSDIGYMVPDPAIFESVIREPHATMVLAARPIPWLAHQGTPTLVYEPGSRSNDPNVVRSPDDVLAMLLS